MWYSGGSRVLRVTAAVVTGSLIVTPAAYASGGGSITPLALFGLPSLHEIIQAIANGFFGALAEALVPSFLKHATVAVIQHLVALPDPGRWGHVGQLQGDMVYLGVSLLPVTLTIATVRYWLVGLTGTAHPTTAVARCAGTTGVLVAYPWMVEQTVAGTNTLTHAILGFPVVGNGLQRLIVVLFGGALLTGAGSVFVAFLVIVGVIFAAGLFALQVLLTLVLALLIVAGPPLIALAAIPELAHLARTWAHALMLVMLVPLAWTVLFATAGALILDATSFTGGAGGIPGHIEAAFAGLATFVLAVRLPMMLLGQIKNLLGASAGGSGARGGGQGGLPGTDRMRAAHARLRSAAFVGVPAAGRSVGRAAGALGAPQGGPVGAARRRLGGLARRGAGITGAAVGAAGGARIAAAAKRAATPKAGKSGIRQRFARAGAILANSPREARAAMAASMAKPTRTTGRSRGAHGTRAGTSTGQRERQAASPTNAPRARVAAPGVNSQATGQVSPSRSASRAGTPAPRQSPAQRPVTGGTNTPSNTGGGKPALSPHPGQKVTSTAQREASTRNATSRTGGSASQRASKQPPQRPSQSSPTPKTPARRGLRKRKGKP